jgi:CheY-like chemotaxis protein
VLDGIARVTYNSATMSRSLAAAMPGEPQGGALETGIARRRLRLLPNGPQRSGEANSDPQTKRLMTASKRPLRILIVDDDPAVAATLEEMITEAGGESVGIITSALAAIGAAAVISPDVVLMDVRLPGAMDGIEAAGIIRARGSAAVVIITGAVSDPEIHARLRSQDGFEVVFKPVLEDELFEAIRRAYSARY